MEDDIYCPECGSDDLYFAGYNSLSLLHEIEFEADGEEVPEKVLEWECESCGDCFETFE